jgi:cell division septation protein DedD
VTPPVDTEGEERIAAQAEEAKNIIESLSEEGVEAVVDDTSKTTPQPNEEESSEPVEESVAPPAQEKLEPAPQLASAPEPKEEPAAAQPVPSGNWVVQLASLKSDAAARAEWSSSKTKYAPHLNGFNYRVERVDLGDKGIFYRLQAGPTTETRARQLCAEIKKTNPDGCIVKKN